MITPTITPTLYGSLFSSVLTAKGLGYITDGLVLDLTSSFSESSVEVEDKANDNDAILYTGRYVMTDGVSGHAINADCSSFGRIVTPRLTGKIRSTTTGNHWASLASGIDGQVVITVDEANVWQEFSWDGSYVTCDEVAVGWNGLTNFSAADWSDVKLTNADTGEVLGHVTPRS